MGAPTELEPEEIDRPALAAIVVLAAWTLMTVPCAVVVLGGSLSGYETLSVAMAPIAAGLALLKIVGTALAALGPLSPEIE